MTEILHEESTLIILLLFLFGIGLIGTVAVVFLSLKLRPTGTATYQEMQSSQPIWSYKTVTYTPKRKPVHRRLPYGAYGTDIRGRLKRQQDARE